VKLAIIRYNVTLIDNEAELNTEFLDYDLNTDVGYYFNGGIILSDENTLSSIQGNYNTKQKEFHFKDSVVIVNPDYTIFSDTMKYNTVSEISYFFGPTEIIGDSSYLYCEDGWYNTKTDISNLRKNALVKSKNQTVKGDSIYYEKINGYGKAYGNVELTDTLKDIIIRGNFSEYFEQPERFFVTDSAVFIQITSTDSLFVHADTLRSFMDSTETYRTVSAYYHCKIYKDDFQAKCDSMVYSFRDSVIHLYNDPVLWSEKNQLTADSIFIFTKNGSADHLEMYNRAFIITQEDSIRFNQIKGKNMIAFFRDDDLYRINVTGNGETIYYTIDEEEIVGVNQALCSDIIIYLENEEISKISFLGNPDGIMSPPDYEDPENLKLEGFSWLESFRPLNKWDIFKWK
jgi:lipopolysaccharide export system protein LptA